LAAITSRSCSSMANHSAESHLLCNLRAGGSKGKASLRMDDRRVDAGGVLIALSTECLGPADGGGGLPEGEGRPVAKGVSEENEPNSGPELYGLSSSASTEESPEDLLVVSLGRDVVVVDVVVDAMCAKASLKTCLPC
jgi:hypothetical protein